MTRTAMAVAFVLGLLAYGCGQSNHELVDSTSTSTPVPQSGTGPTYSLRLLGVDLGDFTAATMRVQSVQVTGGGAVLANTVKSPEVDLARTASRTSSSSSPSRAALWPPARAAST